MAALVSRSAVLVTGRSGRGKSTVLAELGRRGHGIVDTDNPGRIVRVAAPHGIEPMWDLERVGALYSTGGAPRGLDALTELKWPKGTVLNRALLEAARDGAPTTTRTNPSRTRTDSPDVEAAVGVEVDVDEQRRHSGTRCV
jgi:hypothetical protein